MDNDDLIIDEKTGTLRPRWAVEAVDRFLALASYKPMWEVIDFIVSVHLKKHPEFFTKAPIEMQNKFGSNKAKDMRQLLSIPADLKDTIDLFYKDEINSIGQIKFWRKFVKKYPMFTNAEKI